MDATPPLSQTAGRPPFPPNVALLLMVIIWAVNFTVAKLTLAVLSPLALNALRFPMALAVVYVALRLRGRVPLPEPGDVKRVILLGILGNLVYQQFFIFGLNLTRAGTASVLLSATPIMTALLSAALGHERISRRAWIGAAATMAGIALVVGSGLSEEGGSIPGDLLMLGASASWALYTVGSRPLVERYGAMAMTTWTLAIGTFGVVLIGLPDVLRTDLGALSPVLWLAIVYAGALSIGLAYLIWYYGVRQIGNTRTAIYSNLVPVVAMFVAWLWLNERPTATQIAGAAIIIAGVTLVQLRPRRRRMS
jgi:drug/metabolite transporter (DMT)-like permease